MKNVLIKNNGIMIKLSYCQVFNEIIIIILVLLYPDDNFIWRVIRSINIITALLRNRNYKTNGFLVPNYLNWVHKTFHSLLPLIK